MNVHHFEKDIAGRLYQVEVTSVGGRWRAQLRRAAGMPTAMMPFYGATPEEAARQLTQWLTLAHRRQPTVQPLPPPPGVAPDVAAVKQSRLPGATTVRYD